MTDPVPSKDQVSQAWDDLNALVTFAHEQGFHEMGYSPLNVIDSALADARRENVRWENAHKILLAEIERLKRPAHEPCARCVALEQELDHYKHVAQREIAAGRTIPPPGDG